MDILAHNTIIRIARGQILRIFLSIPVIVFLASAMTSTACLSDTSVAKTTGIGKALFRSSTLAVGLAPTEHAKADARYVVDLYEKGKLRATSHVSWNQSELNVRTTKSVTFPLSAQEDAAYPWPPLAGSDLSHVFSVKVHK
jgi:hypothetical protein